MNNNVNATTIEGGQEVPAGALTSRLNIPAEKMMAYTAGLPEGEKEAIRWLYGFAQENGLGLKELEVESKISSTSLYRIFSGTYQAGLANLVERIESFRRVAEERSTMKSIGFVETSVAKKINKVCEWALLSQSMSFVYGVSQIGKTTALEEYARRNNHGRTKYIRLPASAGVQLCMKEIAKACYVSPKSSYENLRDRVLHAIDGDNLVIIDELHQVFLSYQKGSAIKVLEVLREIHDRTKCGMVLCGTLQLRKELMLGSNQELLEQFKRRGILEVLLPKTPPKGDVKKIQVAYGFESDPMGEAEELRTEILSTHGLGKFCRFLQAAGRMATKSKEPLDWPHFIRAYHILHSLSIGGLE